MKTCIRCQSSKPLDDFGNYSRYPDGKHRYCRACWNTIQADYKHAHGVTPVLPFLDRFWSHIQQCGHEDVCPYCCWPWLSTKDKDGYGRFAVTYQGHKINVVATHVLYEVWHGRRLSPGLFICHHCDTPSCMNPLHIWPGTLNDNRQDCVRKGRTAKGLAAGVHTKPEAFPRGEKHHKAKLTAQQVLEIRADYAKGFITIHRLSEHYDVSGTAIKNILYRKTWIHI